MIKNLLTFAILIISCSLSAVSFSENGITFLSPSDLRKCNILLKMIQEPYSEEVIKQLKIQLLVELKTLQNLCREEIDGFSELVKEYEKNLTLDSYQSIYWANKAIEKGKEADQMLRDLEIYTKF
jgi:hypothetical protein